LDDHNHPVDPQKADLTDKRYHGERCYKMVLNIQINETLDYFYCGGETGLREDARVPGSL
jgi:hypothetical protein